MINDNWYICLMIIWKNGCFRNREYTKQQSYSVLLSLFMRTNGKCNNSHTPSTGLSGTLPSVRTQFSWRTSIWKILTLYRCMGRSFPNSSQKQRQLLRPLNNLENGSFRHRENLQYKKTAELLGSIESVHENNGKCNDSHAPSTGLSGTLPSVRTQYSWRTIIIYILYSKYQSVKAA